MPKPPAVCYVLADYPVLSQTFVHAEMVALRAAGVRVGVVCHRAGDPTIRFGDGPDGAPFPILHSDLSQTQALDAVLADFDHLHGHFADFGLRVLQEIAERTRTPFSFMCHAYDLFRRDAAVTMEDWQTLSPLCTKVVTISRFHRDFIATAGVDPERIAIVPNAARLSGLIHSAPPAPTQLKRILAVGRPTPKKGFGVLLEAWKRAKKHAPELELEIIGTQVPNKPLPSGLHLSGLRPYGEVLRAMSQADLVVAPSVAAPNGDMDGIPTVLAEAGALRRPVIASRIAGIPDLVAPGVNGLLVEPGDPHALAMALVRLAQRPSELTRMGVSGPRLAACHDAEIAAQRLIRDVFSSPAPRSAKILVADSFSSANRGDAAILEGILSGLRERLPDAQLQVISHQPQVGRSFHPGVEFIGDNDPIAMARALVDTDLVVSCGGSFLNDLYALNLGPRLAFYQAAHRAEIPVVFFAQSIGPLDSPLSRMATREVLDQAAWIVARDPASARIVRELGVGAPIHQGVDAAILHPLPQEKEERTLPTLGVTVRHWHFPGHPDPSALQSAYEDNVAQACQRWLDATGGRIRLLSNCTDLGGYRQDDRLTAQRVADRIRGDVRLERDPAISFQALREQAGACDFFLGTRMHSLIFATTAGVPAVGVAYEFKTPEYLGMCGLEGLSVDIADCAGLPELLMKAWAHRDSHRANLLAALPELQERAHEQLDTLAAIAKGKRIARPRSGTNGQAGWQGETFKYDTAHRRLRKVVDTVLGEGGRRVLDVGCSTGLVGRMLGKPFDYQGVDISHAVVTGEPRFRIQQADLNQQPLPAFNGRFDSVVCSGSLEYLDDLAGTLRQLRERAQPGALGVFTLYNLSHFARATGRASRHPTWRFQARPDELVLALYEAGWSPQRLSASAAGYGPSQAVNAEHPTDWDRSGSAQLPPHRLVRLGHQIVVVARAVAPRPGPQAIEDLAGQGKLLEATHVAVSLVKRFGWSARAWSDLSVLYHLAGDPQLATKNLLKALTRDPANDTIRQNLEGLGVDPRMAFHAHPDTELRLMLDPSDPERWKALIAERIAAHRLSEAATLHALMQRAMARQAG
ncbi:MAG: polysaccharide pyruvyl transferase family protein [Myxococcota bacterium]|nr:polysaccharide pyruvyl transferase family protein [Myxococcota bacterium]